MGRSKWLPGLVARTVVVDELDNAYLKGWLAKN